MNSTIKDIARLSGVGISTVSRVINNKGSTSEKTKKKVMAIIDEMNFIPNNNARNLKSPASKNIALLVKDITNPFFNKMINVMEQKVALRGYSLLLQSVPTSADELNIAIQEKVDRNLCGVIIVGGSYQYSDEKFRQLDIPCVLLTISANKVVSSKLYSSVRIDDETEGFKATEYLIQLGHKRIAFLYYIDPNIITPNYLRFQGYKRALETYNISYDPDLVPILYPNENSGYEIGFNMVHRMLLCKCDMTAIFAFADILAIGAAKAVLTMGYRIPEDISVIGFDGIEMSEFYHPALDTISQPASQMAISSIDILFDMMQGGKAQHIVLDCSHLKRGSTKKWGTYSE